MKILLAIISILISNLTNAQEISGLKQPDAKVYYNGNHNIVVRKFPQISDSAKPAERNASPVKNTSPIKNTSQTNVITKYDKAYIALSLGMAFPFGDFSDYSLNNSDNGFANLGIMYDLSLTYYLSAKFGLAGLVRGQNNSIDLDDYLNEIVGGGSSVDWSVNSDSWNINTFLFGIELGFSRNEKGGTYMRLLGGILNATYPEFEIILSGSNSSEFVKQASSTGSGFAFLWSYGFRYKFNDKICLVGNVDLMGGFPEFKNVEITSSVTSQPLYDNLKPSIWNVDLNLGIGYIL